MAGAPEISVGSALACIDAALAGRAFAAPPPPWCAWLVVGLVVQRERQRWHREIVTTRLDHAADTEGDVPGVPGWRYDQHGMGYCLIGPDGELIDVDFRDDAAAVIDPWFFAARVKSVAGTRLAEGRLWRWRPKTDFIVDGLDLLAERGVIIRPEAAQFFTLAPPLAARAGDVTADLAAPDAEVRWRRALGDRDDAAQQAAHRDWLVAQLATSTRRGQILEVVLDVVGADVGFALLRGQLGGAADYPAGRAIELLRERPELPPCEEVTALLGRIEPAQDPPYPGYQAVAYLLERGIAPAFARARFIELAAVRVAPGFRGNPFESSLAILALRFLPDCALPLIRRALRSTTPICVQEIAAVLAVLDQPWCHRELVAALSEDRRPTHPYLVAALRRTSGDLARRRADAHDHPPPRDADQIGFSYEDVAYANADTFMDHAFESARPQAEPLRGRYPDDWCD